jgi:hypothetical protein
VANPLQVDAFVGPQLNNLTISVDAVLNITPQTNQGQVYFVSIVFPREESKKVRYLLFACCCKNSFPDPGVFSKNQLRPL